MSGERTRLDVPAMAPSSASIVEFDVGRSMLGVRRLPVELQAQKHPTPNVHAQHPEKKSG